MTSQFMGRPTESHRPGKITLLRRFAIKKWEKMRQMLEEVGSGEVYLFVLKMEKYQHSYCNGKEPTKR